MYTTYHLSSAEEITTDLLDAIKAAYKSKPITITVQEDAVDFELSTEMKEVLEDRLLEDESTYLPANDALKHLKKKYGI